MQTGGIWTVLGLQTGGVWTVRHANWGCLDCVGKQRVSELC